MSFGVPIFPAISTFIVTASFAVISFSDMSDLNEKVPTPPEKSTGFPSVGKGSIFSVTGLDVSIFVTNTVSSFIPQNDLTRRPVGTTNTISILPEGIVILPDR